MTLSVVGLLTIFLVILGIFECLGNCVPVCDALAAFFQSINQSLSRCALYLSISYHVEKYCYQILPFIVGTLYSCCPGVFDFAGKKYKVYRKKFFFFCSAFLLNRCYF